MTTTKRPTLTRRGVMAAGLLLSAPALAQAPWPSRPIRMVVPFPPGGLTDLQARLLAERMSADLGQQIIVENRGGGGGVIGAEAVARSAPDGYTLLFNISPHVQTPVVMRRFPYHPVDDFAPIGRLSTTPIVLMTGPAVPPEVLTFRQFIEWGRGRRLAFGNIAAGSTGHAFGIMLGTETGLDFAHVAYRGEAPAVQDMLAGALHIAFLSMAGSGEQVRTGRFKAVAVTGEERFAGLPNTPTLREQGFSARFSLENFGGLFAPAGTPPAIVQRLEQSFRAAATSDGLRQRLTAIDVVPAYLDAAAFRALVGRIMTEWTRITEELNLRLES